MQKNIFRNGALTAAAAVALGAFGAHMLEGFIEDGKIAAERLSTWHTAVEYQFYGAFGLCLLAFAAQYNSPRRVRLVKIFMIDGILVFCGSLYILVLSPLFGGAEFTWLGAVTPIGGLLFILSWLFLFFSEKQKPE